jgi:hypothetical protein
VILHRDLDPIFLLRRPVQQDGLNGIVAVNKNVGRYSDDFPRRAPDRIFRAIDIRLDVFDDDTPDQLRGEIRFRGFCILLQ